MECFKASDKFAAPANEVCYGTPVSQCQFSHTCFFAICLSLTEFLRHIKCAKPEFAGPMHDCVLTAQEKIAYLGTLSKDDLVPGGCCLYIKVKQCVIDAVERVCGPVTDDAEESAEYLSEMMTAMFGQAQQLVCGSKFQELTDCAGVTRILDVFDKIDEERFAKRQEGSGEETSDDTTTSPTPDKQDSLLFPVVNMFISLGYE